MMNPGTGGYFELELRNSTEHHKDSIALNTGRNCLEYILKTKKYTLIYIPYYMCDVILEPIKKTNTKFIYYSIDHDLKPIIEDINYNSALLYINYFGICEKQVKALIGKSKNLIIDNSQSFYSEPIKGTSTFYSCRKFFGVSDGSYLCGEYKLEEGLEIDISENRISHLIKRIEYGAENGYEYFLKNDASLMNQPIKLMSKLTHTLLKNIDYEYVKKRRIENFNYLHKELELVNELNIEINYMICPMVYPLVIKNENLREMLIKHKIYIPTFWYSVLQSTNEDSYENYLVKHLLPLPIDQRYNLSDMAHVASTIKRLLNA